MIGVHYRSYTTSADFGGIADITSLFTKYMKDASQKDPNTRFFLAADNLSFRDQIIKNVGQDLILTFPIAKVDRNSFVGLTDSITEWYLLANTDYIIGTYQSSFSEEAAHLTKSKRKINLGGTIFGDAIHSIICFDKSGNAYVRPDEPGDPCVSGTRLH